GPSRTPDHLRPRGRLALGHRPAPAARRDGRAPPPAAHARRVHPAHPRPAPLSDHRPAAGAVLPVHAGGPAPPSLAHQRPPPAHPLPPARTAPPGLAAPALPVPARRARRGGPGTGDPSRRGTAREALVVRGRVHAPAYARPPGQRLLRRPGRRQPRPR